MNNKTLFIYELPILYDIFKEIEEYLNFKIISFTKKKILNTEFEDYDHFLVLSNKKNSNLPNLILIDSFPIKFTKLLEKINVEFLKKNFIKQSNVNIGQYIININSRQMTLENQKLKLTEKEIDTIIFLSKNELPIRIDELQEKVWGYQSKLETHTVETHIHRLRKKIKEKFFDDNFIISRKNGYQISKKK